MNEEKSRKPYRNYLWFVLIIAIIVVIVIMQTLFQMNTQELFANNQKNTFIISSIIAGLIVTTIIYHLGKAIFAMFTGFKVVAISILILTFKKQDEKWTIDLGFEGLGGMVHVVPKASYEKCKPILYHFGGLITSIAFATITALVLYFADSTHKNAVIFLMSALTGIVILLVNLIPLYIDDINDGFAIRLLLDKNNIKVYLDNLLQYAALNYNYGKLKYYTYDNYDNTLQANSLIYQYYYFMDQEDFESAEKSCLKLLEHRSFAFHENVSISEVNKLYFYILKENANNAYDYFYSLDKEYRNLVLSTSNYETLKTGILVACKVEKTYDLYEHLLKSEKKTKDKYYSVRVESEAKLIAKAKEIALTDFPDWEN